MVLTCGLLSIIPNLWAQSGAHFQVTTIRFTPSGASAAAASPLPLKMNGSSQIQRRYMEIYITSISIIRHLRLAHL